LNCVTSALPFLPRQTCPLAVLSLPNLQDSEFHRPTQLVAVGSTDSRWRRVAAGDRYAAFAAGYRRTKSFSVGDVDGPEEKASLGEETSQTPTQPSFNRSALPAMLPRAILHANIVAI
jgi:hypothetical protein